LELQPDKVKSSLSIPENSGEEWKMPLFLSGYPAPTYLL
jgi:hypothetical protein